MKKLLSLVLTVLILSSFATVGFANDDYNVSFVVQKMDGTVITDIKDLAVNDIFLVNVMLDVIPEDLTVAIVNVSYDDSVSFYTSQSKQVTASDFINGDTYWKLAAEDWNNGSVSGKALTYSGAVFNTGSYKFNAAKPFFTMYFQKKTETGTANITIEKLNLAHKDGANYFAVGTPSVSLALSDEVGGGEEEVSDILDKVAPEAVTAKAEYQIGTGIGMTVTAPEGIAFSKMIWAITRGAERVYSEKVEFPVAVSGDVRVAAVFVNGTHDDVYKNVEIEEHYEIGENDFDAIFYGVNAENTEEYVRDYFTNEDDKKE